MKKYLGILWLLCIVGLIFFLGHYSGILIDFSREVYYPEQILNGKVLYKDLFNIYGPLAYQINAVLYKIFGVKLETLYCAGILCSLLTVSGIFLIARKYLSDFLSFCIGVLVIAIGITTTNIFNFHFPYSWAMLYGLIAFIYSLLFLIKFEESKDNKFLYISTFLAGICTTCKYDFLIYSFVILCFLIREKNFKPLITFLIPPLFSYAILFIQGMNFSDLINYFDIAKTMAHTKTLTYFYQNSGVYFNKNTLYWDIFNFICFIIPFTLFLFGSYLFYKSKILSKVFALLICATSLIIFWFEIVTEKGTLIGFLPLFTILFGICSFKKFDIKLGILFFATISICCKIIWVLMIGSYGTYYAPLLIITVLAILFKYLPEKFEKNIGIYILFFCLVYFSYNLYGLSVPKHIVQTPKGKIITGMLVGKSSSELIDYIDKNTKPDDKIVILPEGMIMNFLTNRKSDDFYNSLIPLYIETFGEEKIIEHFNENKPDYIIFNNLDMKDYHYRYICQDYALKFCEFVKENYKPETVIDNNFRYIIFKKL